MVQKKYVIGGFIILAVANLAWIFSIYSKKEVKSSKKYTSLDQNDNIVKDDAFNDNIDNIVKDNAFNDNNINNSIVIDNTKDDNHTIKKIIHIYSEYISAEESIELKSILSTILSTRKNFAFSKISDLIFSLIDNLTVEELISKIDSIESIKKEIDIEKNKIGYLKAIINCISINRD